MPVTAQRKIIFVPGKNPKPEPNVHRQRLWRALLAGVAHADPVKAQALATAPDRFVLAPWNKIYYHESRPAEIDAAAFERLLQRRGADAADRKEAHSWRRKRARLLYSLGDLFPFLISLVSDPAIKSTIAETLHYFQNRDGIGARVRETLKAPLRAAFAAGEPVLLIAHSMGSVIAYDALWELWHEEHNRGRVDLFLTLGSPLGMRYAQKRLVGFRNHGHARFPGNIRHWINVSTEGDLTALDPTLRDDLSPMTVLGLTESIMDIHDGVYGYFRNEEGLNVHRSYGYLVQPVVGAAIARWLHGETQPAAASADTDEEPMPARPA
jgi:hypothetical protein